MSGRLASLVRPDEGIVSARVFVDQELFERERELIWGRCWLYAGHESEIPEPADYVSRTVGTVPLLLTRGADGTVHAFANRCAHRGNMVCTRERGSDTTFRCNYHGWSYRNDGTLIGVPYPSAYEHPIDKTAWGLAPVARLATYRGLIFVSHSADGPSLLEHLGLAREPLDRFLDASPTGRIDLGAGYNRVQLDANWKMYVENSSDNYHANFTHASAFSTPEQRKMSAAVSRDASLAVVRALGNGHSDVDFRPEQRAQGGILFTGNASAVDPEQRRAYMQALADRLGEQQATTLVEEGPPTVYVFPNLFVIQQDVRRLEPVSVGRSHLYQHPALLDGAPDAINQQRLSRHEAAYGPAGFVLSDDIEMFARNQRIVEANPDHPLKISRGLHREATDDQGARVSHVTDETGIRDMWRNYARYMSEEAL